MHCSMEPKWSNAKFMHNYDYFQHLKIKGGISFPNSLRKSTREDPNINHITPQHGKYVYIQD
jgi:hypothetical protein